MLALVAIIGGEPQAVFRQVGEGFVDCIGMKEQRIARLIIDGVPYIGMIGGNAMTADSAGMADGVFEVAVLVRSRPDGKAT